MQIEEGKYYKTRDGRKIGPAVKSGTSNFEFSGEWKFCHTPDGKYLGDPHQHGDLNIVSEWPVDAVAGVISNERLVFWLSHVETTNPIDTLVIKTAMDRLT